MKDNNTQSLECGINSIPVMSKLFDLADGKTSLSSWENNLDPNKLNLILEVYPLEFIKLDAFDDEKSLKDCIDDILGAKATFGNKIPKNFYRKDLYLIM